jgi:hypothetical protein
MALKHQGNEGSKIWLIGDSDPENSGPELEYVFDDRHPTIHNIWTSIIYKIQRIYYKEKSKMIDDDNFFVINAIHDSGKKPGKDVCSWDSNTIGNEKADYIEQSMEKIKNIIKLNEPQMIITFGAFSFEFVRRCEGEKVKRPYGGNWNTKELRKQFICSIKEEKKIVPLLHRSISMGYFLSSHRYFSDANNEYNINGNYFKFVSEYLYQRFVKILKLY